MSFRLAVVVSTVIFCGVLLAARVHAQVPVCVSAPDPTTEPGSASAEDPAAPLASEPVADELPLAGGISPEAEPSAHEEIVPATLSATPAAPEAASARPSSMPANLTPFGAEVAGNDSGTIPAWNGGISSPPPCFVAAHGRY